MKSNYEHPPFGFLPLNRAAGWAGVSVRTLRRWIDEGLPKYQAGPRSKVLIRPVDIEAFLIKWQLTPIDLDSVVNEVFGEIARKGD